MGDFGDIGISLNILLTDTDISVSVELYQINKLQLAKEALSPDGIVISTSNFKGLKMPKINPFRQLKLAKSKCNNHFPAVFCPSSDQNINLFQFIA